MQDPTDNRGLETNAQKDWVFIIISQTGMRLSFEVMLTESEARTLPIRPSIIKFLISRGVLTGFTADLYNIICNGKLIGDTTTYTEMRSFTGETDHITLRSRGLYSRTNFFYEPSSQVSQVNPAQFLWLSGMHELFLRIQSETKQMKNLHHKAAYTYLSTVLSQILQGTVESFVSTNEPELYSIPKNIHEIIITFLHDSSITRDSSITNKEIMGEDKLKEIKAQLREGSLKIFEEAGAINYTYSEERKCVVQ